MKDPHKNTHTSLSRLRGPSHLITKFHSHSVYVRFHRFLANYHTEFQRASSEPSFDSSSGPRRSTSPRRVKHSATHSCPIPGCGAIFTRSVNFRVHLRTHKDHKSRHVGSSSPSSGPSRTFVKQQLDRKRHDRDLLPSDHFRSFKCMGCRRQFPQMDALDRHLKSEIGVECMKVVESCKEVRDMEMDMEVDMEVDKGIGTMEMEDD